jgi:hypothetical protein
VIAVNTTGFTCPWADVLFAVDKNWWNVYGDRARAEFEGELVCPQAIAGATRSRSMHFANSGAGALSLAAYRGARRIIGIGFDCQRTGGKTHHHGDHPKGLSNGGTMQHWPARFAAAAKHLAGIGVDVVNASRVSALTCFRRATLEECLGIDDLHLCAREHRSAA